MNLKLKKIFLLFILPIVTLVIGGLILDRLTSFEPWTHCKSVIKAITAILSHQPEFPVWIILCIFLTGITIPILYSILRRSRNDSHFKINGICWEWTLPEQTGTDGELIPRCPKCMYELQQPQTNDLLPENLARRFIPMCILQCENCRFEKTFHCRYDLLLQRTRKEIERRILISRHHPFRRLSILLKNKGKYWGQHSK
jgi:hypothetical protein